MAVPTCSRIGSAQVRGSQGGRQLVQRSVRLAVSAQQVPNCAAGEPHRRRKHRSTNAARSAGSWISIGGKENAFGIFGRLRHRRILSIARFETRCLPETYRTTI